MSIFTDHTQHDCPPVMSPLEYVGFICGLIICMVATVGWFTIVAGFIIGIEGFFAIEITLSSWLLLVAGISCGCGVAHQYYVALIRERYKDCYEYDDYEEYE